MRSAAKVGEITLCIRSDCTVFEVVFNVFNLIMLPVGLKLFDCIGFGNFLTDNRFVLFCQFLHFVFYLRKVVFGDSLALWRHYIIKETVLYCRPEAELNTRIKFLKRLGKQVRRRVPEGMFTLFIIKLKKLNAGIFHNRAVQFTGFSINLARYNVASKSRRKTLCNLITSYALLVITNRSVWESDFNHITN